MSVENAFKMASGSQLKIDPNAKYENITWLEKKKWG